MAALDTSDDGEMNYDTLVFFNAAEGIRPGPFQLPSTGPAYVHASSGKSSPFFLEGSSNKAGLAFYVTMLSPDLAAVRLARSSANAISMNPLCWPTWMTLTRMWDSGRLSLTSASQSV